MNVHMDARPVKGRAGSLAASVGFLHLHLHLQLNGLEWWGILPLDLDSIMIADR